jgi:hypothetical protein
MWVMLQLTAIDASEYRGTGPYTVRSERHGRYSRRMPSVGPGDRGDKIV